VLVPTLVCPSLGCKERACFCCRFTAAVFPPCCDVCVWLRLLLLLASNTLHGSEHSVHSVLHMPMPVSCQQLTAYSSCLPEGLPCPSFARQG